MRLVLLITLLAATAHAEEPWKQYANKDGVSYEKRAVAGSKFFEYRASALVQSVPQTVLERIWSGVTNNVPKTVKKREVLRRTESEFLVYDRIKAPVVSDRDVAILIRKLSDPTRGVLEVKFESTDANVPLDPNHVRIPVVRGGWTLVPAANGATQLSYQCYSEPGGSIPAWIARGAQQDQVVLDFERIFVPLRGSP
jgi:hypothetical protein